MEFLIVFTTIIVSLFTGGGLILNNSLTNIIENKSVEIGETKVRINSVPTYGLIEGKADSILVSLKQWQPFPNIRVELLELETDAVEVNLSMLKKFKVENWRQILNKPLSMGWRTILTEEDLNNLFLSSQTQSLIKQYTKDSGVELLDLKLDLRSNNRISIDSVVKLANRNNEILNVNLEFNLELIKGHSIKIENIEGTLNNRKLSSILLQGFADNINDQLNLQNLEKSGVTMRILRCNFQENSLEIAGFIHLTP